MSTAATRCAAFSKKTIRDIEVDGTARARARRLQRAARRRRRRRGRVADDSRIRAALPTLECLREQEREAGARLAPGPARRVRTRRSRWRRSRRGSRSSRAGPCARRPRSWARRSSTWRASSAAGDVLVLENSRFEPGETKNDPDAGRRARATCRRLRERRLRRGASRPRDHGGCRAPPAPGGRGLPARARGDGADLVADRIPERPFVVVLGGAKVSDKIGVIERFLEVADAILIGGAMCFSFFRAMGRPDRRLAGRGGGGRAGAPRAGAGRERRAAGSSCPGTSCSPTASTPTRSGAKSRRAPTCPRAGWGWTSARAPRERVRARRSRPRATVFWNGPMGAFEMEPFAAGTRAVAEAIARCDGNDRRGRGRLRRGARRVRPRGVGHPRVDGRRRLARAARGQAAARRGGAR